MLDCWGFFGIVMVGTLAQAGLGLQSFRLAQYCPCQGFGIMSSLPLTGVARCAHREDFTSPLSMG